MRNENRKSVRVEESGVTVLRDNGQEVRLSVSEAQELVELLKEEGIVD